MVKRVCLVLISSFLLVSILVFANLQLALDGFNVCNDLRISAHHFSGNINFT